MLRDIRIGATLFVLNKKERTIGHAEVLQALPSTPQFQYNPNMPIRQTVAIRAKMDGKEVVFNNLYADQVSCEDNGGGIVVCENKDALVAELKAFKVTNDNIVSRMEEFSENSKWCDERLIELDPVRQAEVQNNQQISELRNEIAELRSLVSKSLGLQKGKEK